MRVLSDLHVEWVDDEAVVLNAETQEIHYLNGTAALLLALIEEHGLERAVERLHKEFRATEGFDAELDGLIEAMMEKGLLIDE